ncbi:MAG: hypothetical protein HY286_05425 [Planctomycetes bacterium]|nr:hypothetical protein [Planctomycetota bacterium]
MKNHLIDIAPSAACFLLILTIGAARQDGRPAESKPASAPVAPVFSGPQIGEKTASFKVNDVTGKREPKEFDPVADAAGAPALYFLFPSDMNRIIAKGITNIGMISEAAKEAGMKAYFIGLGVEPIAADQRLRNVWLSLKPPVAASLSVDGVEGPGNWGINKNCYVTLVLAKDGKVVYNYAALSPADSDYETIQNEVGKLINKKISVKLVTPEGRMGMGSRGGAASRPVRVESRPASRPAEK